MYLTIRGLIARIVRVFWRPVHYSVDAFGVFFVFKKKKKKNKEFIFI